MAARVHVLQGNITKWRKAVGEQIAPGQILAEVETDKATIEWEVQEEGFVAKLLVAEGARDIPLGTPVAVLAEDAGSVGAFKDFVPGRAGCQGVCVCTAGAAQRPRLFVRAGGPGAPLTLASWLQLLPCMPPEPTSTATPATQAPHRPRQRQRRRRRRHRPRHLRQRRLRRRRATRRTRYERVCVVETHDACGAPMPEARRTILCSHAVPPFTSALPRPPPSSCLPLPTQTPATPPTLPLLPWLA